MYSTYSEGCVYDGVEYVSELPEDIKARISAKFNKEMNLLLRMPEYRADYEAILRAVESKKERGINT